MAKLHQNSKITKRIPSNRILEHSRHGLAVNTNLTHVVDVIENSYATLKNHLEEISTVLATNDVQVLNNSATNTYNVYLAHLPAPQDVDITQAPGTTNHDANTSVYVAERMENAT